MLKLESKEATRTCRQRQRVGLEKERARDVRKHLEALLAEVTVGSKRLYDGLSALSLDGQPLALAIEAHLGRPALPPPPELPRGLCAAAGLSMERVTDSQRLMVDGL